MYAQTIRRLLELAPVGLSNDQLLWRLKTSGLRASAQDILATLNELSATGEVEFLTTHRWRLRRFSVLLSSVPQARSPNTGSIGDSQPAVLRAVTFRIAPRSVDLVPDLAEVESAIDSQGLPDFQKLLKYFAATQRSDPRGEVDERLDNHGLSWQLFRAEGAWWDNAELRIATGLLPEAFREALTRRPDSTCAIGYPVSCFNDKGLPTFAPGLLLPASYQFDGPDLVIELQLTDPIINPHWLKEVGRRSRWQAANLADAILPEGESANFDEVIARLPNALATLGGGLLRPAHLAEELTLAGEGLRNAAAMFLPSDGTFTRGAERDLEAISGWTSDVIQTTALGSLLANAPSLAVRQRESRAGDTAPVGPRPLTDSQFAAAETALAGPLTLIQGPPGTGKSEVILTLAISLLLAGKTVLIAARNHQALDEVERRLSQIVGERPLLTRGSDRDGERDTNFLAQLRMIAEGEHADNGDLSPRTLVQSTDVTGIRGPSTALLSDQRLRRRRQQLMISLSVIAERLDNIGVAPVPPTKLPTRTGISIAQMRARFHSVLMWPWRRVRASKAAFGAMNLASEQASFQQDYVRLYREFESLPQTMSDEKLEQCAAELSKLVVPALKKLAERVTIPTAAEKRFIVERLKDLNFNKTTARPILSAEDARLVLSWRPGWAISSLSVPSRVPLVPGLFDTVIFDEASQCDIASALPLFARARNAVIVGDPQQLGFIPSLGIRKEHALMDAAGLPKVGRHRFAQSQHSLFEFVAARKDSSWHFLADQFRSAPEIVDYLNDQFYGGRLISRRDNGTLKFPDGFKPGLAWHDVKGRPTREDGGNVNHAEADAIVELVRDMILNRNFNGSIGILSPFNTQIGLLQRKLKSGLPETERRGVEIRVSTIDRFQGGEADVILFSIVIGDGATSARSFFERERRRLNVAISRARALCLVVGDAAYVERSGIRTLQALLGVDRRTHRPREGFDSDWERRLFEAMKLRGLDPVPQYPVGSRSLDFALFAEGVKLDVEVDGRRWHADADGNRKTSDRLRDRQLQALGWRVCRFWVSELAEDMEKCLDLVVSALGGK